MKFKKLSLLLLGGILLAGCSKASAIELSVVPNQSMVTGKAIVIDVKTEPVISIDPNSIEISGGESWVENGVIKFKASQPGQYTMKVTQDNVTSNTITIPLDTSSAIAKNETQSTSKSSQSTISQSTQSSTKQNGTTNNQTNTNPTLNQGQTNQTTPSNQTPTQNTTPSTPSVPTTPTTPSVDPTPSTPAITPDPEPTVPDVVAPSEDITPVVGTPSVEEQTPSVEETPTPTPELQDPTPSVEEDPASTVQDTSMSVDQVYEDQSELIANKTPITVDGILPEALVSNDSGKEEQVLWNKDLKEYIVLEGFTIPFGGCNAQVSGTLSRNAQGQLVLNMTYISTDDVPKTGGTGYHDVDSSTKSTTDNVNVSAIDRNNPTPYAEPGTGQ